MMENLLVCLRHCCDLRKAKDSNVLSVSYLHLFQYHILVMALRYFLDDVQGGVASRRATADQRLSLRSIPTLSTNQTPGKLNNVLSSINCMNIKIIKGCTF